MKEKKQPQKENKKELEIAELTELLQRTQASFENYRKQTEKRFQEIQQIAARDTILQILPLMDNFGLALKNTKNHPEFVQGVELIHAQLNSILENNQIKPIVTKKQLFDPYFHEALLKVESDLPENTIVEELQRGFTLQGKVIRHAKVKISNGKKNSEDENKKEIKLSHGGNIK